MPNSHANDSVGLPYQPACPHPVEPADLEDFHERHRRDTWWLGATILVVVVGMLGLNLYVTSQLHDTLVTDVDASRLAMSATHDETLARLDALEARLAEIEARTPASPPPAVASSR